MWLSDSEICYITVAQRNQASYSLLNKSFNYFKVITQWVFFESRKRFPPPQHQSNLKRQPKRQEKTNQLFK